MTMTTSKANKKSSPTKATNKSSPAKAGATIVKKKSGGGNGGKNKKSAKEIILEIAATELNAGRDVIDRSLLTKGTGLATKTATNNLGKFKNEGLIEYPDPKTFKLTPAGIEACGSLIKVPKTNAERHEHIKEKLKKKEVELFELVMDGEVYKKEDLAKKLGYEDKKTKAFVNLIGGMRGGGILDYPDKDTLQLSDTCFPFGRGNP